MEKSNLTPLELLGMKKLNVLEQSIIRGGRTHHHDAGGSHHHDVGDSHHHDVGGSHHHDVASFGF